MLPNGATVPFWIKPYFPLQTPKLLQPKQGEMGERFAAFAAANGLLGAGTGQFLAVGTRFMKPAEPLGETLGSPWRRKERTSGKGRRGGAPPGDV